MVFDLHSCNPKFDTKTGFTDKGQFIHPVHLGGEPQERMPGSVRFTARRTFCSRPMIGTVQHLAFIVIQDVFDPDVCVPLRNMEQIFTAFDPAN